MSPAFALSEAGIGPLGLALIFLVALAGALAVNRLRGPRRRGALPPAAPREAPDLPPRPEGLPDWRHPENPRLDIPAIAHRVREAAAKCEIDPATLPRFAPPDGSDGDFVFPDKFGTLYVTVERGAPVAEQECVVADELAYRILADRCWMKAYLATAGRGLDEGERMRQVAAEQERMLALADPAWARQAAWERQAKAMRG